jgi:hypothetical protein
MFILDPDLDFLLIPDPGSRGQKGTGSETLDGTVSRYDTVMVICGQCCGSGIGCLFDPWIRDPGWEKVSIRIRDPG